MRSNLGRLEFGGPDLPPRRLRDLLQQYVDQSPPGSRIDWVTYYFRDRALAEALIRASDRGVRVTLVLEPNPRRKGANDAVIAMLAAHGLGGGFHLYRKLPGTKGHLHAKIYAFSEPDIAWIGSFNPSGDVPEDPDVVAEIGDQDRGDNLLLGIERPKLIAQFRRHVQRLARPPLAYLLGAHPFARFRDDDTRLYYYPRALAQLVEREVRHLATGDSVRAAISHLKEGPLTNALKRAVTRGASVKLLVHDTERRVPSALVHDLGAAGLDIRRIQYPDDLPMHAKFILIDRPGERAAWLGSYNFNKRSRQGNAEILLRTSDPDVFAGLDERFEIIAA